MTAGSQLRRSAGVSIALAAVVFLVAASAHAKPTKVSWPGYISVGAAAHTTNDIKMFYEYVKDDNGSFYAHGVFDSAGVTTRVTEPPTCYPIDRSFPTHPWKGKAVVCPDGTSQDDDNGNPLPGQGEDFRISLGDRSDRFDAKESIGSFEVHAGSGNDKLYGENEPIGVADESDPDASCVYFSEDELHGDRGNDRLYGRFGPDHLFGEGGNDYLSGGKDLPSYAEGHLCEGFGGPDDELDGGPGNDTIWAADGDRDLRIDCGPGKHDKAYIDPQDPKPRHCERVKRPKRR